MSKFNYLNVGCGSKFHEEWTNVDMVSTSPHVQAYNLLEGMPYSANQFDVVYHSQVLEHIPQARAADFVRECFRVLRPGGIMRVVVPDLENIAKEYLQFLSTLLEKPDRQTEANYDWILLEMYDQTVRNYSGGQMAEFLRQPNLVDESYVIGRIGYVGESNRQAYLQQRNGRKEAFSVVGMARKMINALRGVIHRLFSSEAKRLGAFRLGGEVHMWMYDRFSLSRLLTQAGFCDIEVKTPFESDIPDWERFELDVKNNSVFDPTSLFMEAGKPNPVP